MCDFSLAETYETVAIHRSGAAARIHLRRPEQMNAWDDALVRDLGTAVRMLAADADVRAVGIVGEGRGFSSGADLRHVLEIDRTPDGRPNLRDLLSKQYNPILLQIREMPKPVLAAVNGPAVGVGVSLALAADIVIARQSAYFLLAFVNIGLVPDGGASLLVPARVGAARAVEMALFGKRIPAPQAEAWGLINESVDDAAFEARHSELLASLAEGPTRAYAGIKAQLNESLYGDFRQQLHLEAGLQQEMAGTRDFAEGVDAFLGKRSPRFTGR